VTSFAAPDGRFYFSEGVARLPQRRVDALVAKNIGHHLLGHTKRRHTLSLGLTAGFVLLGIFVPGGTSARSRSCVTWATRLRGKRSSRASRTSRTAWRPSSRSRRPPWSRSARRQRAARAAWSRAAEPDRVRPISGRIVLL